MLSNDTLKSLIYHRQLDLLTPEQAKLPIIIIGCGGIGSATAFILSKIGCSNLTIYDHDKVEKENIPSQFFSFADIGKFKVQAIKDTIRSFNETDIKALNKKYDNALAPVIICAVDSMATRKEIFDYLKMKPYVSLFIDSRMSGEKMRLYAITPSQSKDQAGYSPTLYSDSQAIAEPCSAKAIAYNTFLIGSLISLIVKKYIRKEKYPSEIIFDLVSLSFIKTDF